MSIKTANEECLKRINEGGAVWTDIRLARDVVPGMADYTVLHAGPPVTWDQMCGPMRGAIIGASMYEGWAKTPEEAVTLAGSGRLKFDSGHHHRSIGPMSGIITPSMQVSVVRNERFGLDTYATLYMGIGKVLRHGAYDEGVMTKLRRLPQMQGAYQVSGTPTLIVNGKYRLSPTADRGFAGMLGALDFVLAKERAEAPAKKNR